MPKRRTAVLSARNDIAVLNMPRDEGPAREDDDAQFIAQRAARITGSKLKRLLDIFGSLLGMAFLSPLFLLVAACIVMESPGSPMFRQRRSGHLGAIFVIYKFRTMRVEEDGDDVVQVQRDDSRVTRVGSLLRRTSIDELPQLFNVLRGDMSLVGPRPHALAHDEFYSQCVRDYWLRFKAKPGLTGLAQVSGLRGPTPNIPSMAARVEKDLEYIRNWTLMGDLGILCRTAVIFAFQPAAY